MTKLRISSTFQMLILSAAVAVFSGLLLVPFSNSKSHNPHSTQSKGTVILMADGSDPVPAPKPLPWRGVAS
jgi:hypothetical protein